MNFEYTKLCFTVGGEATDSRPSKIYQCVRVSEIILYFDVQLISFCKNFQVGFTGEAGKASPSLTWGPEFESWTIPIFLGPQFQRRSQFGPNAQIKHLSIA